MGQLRIWGDKRIDWLETLVPGDIGGLQPNQARLSVLTNEQGGILDDCMVTAKPDHLYMVVNGACKDKDIAHLQQHLAQYNSTHGTSISIEYFSAQWELLAFQGPQAVAVLQRLVPSSVDLSKLPFMFSANIEVAGVQCVVSRCGYTGEDGVEMAVPANQTKKVYHALLSEKVSVHQLHTELWKEEGRQERKLPACGEVATCRCLITLRDTPTATATTA